MARLLVLVGGLACTVSPVLFWWTGVPPGSPIRGANGLGALVGALGVLVTVIAVSRLLGYRDLDTRPAGYLGVAAMVVLVVSLATQQPSGGVGVGVWVALAGVTAVVTGTLLD